MGIEDKHEWIHIDDDCPTYECLTNHDIVTSVLNVSANEHATDIDHIEEDDDLLPPDPSPGCSSRGGQKPEGGAQNQKGREIFKIQYWMYAATGGPNVKWRVPISNGGRAPLASPLATALTSTKTT